jgi:hypothetical protein
MSTQAPARRVWTAEDRPADWPFPPLDAMQQRNVELCHAEARRIERRISQQRLQACLEALGEALL